MVLTQLTMVELIINIIVMEALRILSNKEMVIRTLTTVTARHHIAFTIMEEGTLTIVMGHHHMN